MQSLGYNHCHNILRLLLFYQIFLSPQVKQRVIISNKHGIYRFPHKLQNLGSYEIYEISQKSQNFIELKPSAQSYSQNEIFASTSK